MRLFQEIVKAAASTALHHQTGMWFLADTQKDHRVRALELPQNGEFTIKVLGKLFGERLVENLHGHILTSIGGFPHFPVGTRAKTLGERDYTHSKKKNHTHAQ
jgi:hypothetical protein